MAAPKGHPKWGGRVKGSVNQATALMRERLKQVKHLTVDQALRNVSAIANHVPEKYTGSDVIKANELLLKVHGALRDAAADSRITVNIGFLARPETATDHSTTIDVQVLPSSSQVASADE